MSGLRESNPSCKELCQAMSGEKLSEKPCVIWIAPLDRNLVQLDVNHDKGKALVDTAGTISWVDSSFLTWIGITKPFKPSNLKEIVGICGEIHQVLGKVQLPLCINRLKVHHTFYVFQRLHHVLFLGLDFVEGKNAEVDFQNKTLSLQNRLTMVLLIHPNIDHPAAFVKTVWSIVLSPHSEVVTNVHVSGNYSGSAAMLEPLRSLMSNDQLAGSRCLVNVKEGQTVY